MTEAVNERHDMRYTLKKDGKFFTAQGSILNRTVELGFFAAVPALAYTYRLPAAREMQEKFGGQIVEVLPGPVPYSRREGRVVE